MNDNIRQNILERYADAISPYAFLLRYGKPTSEGMWELIDISQENLPITVTIPPKDFGLGFFGCIVIGQKLAFDV